MNQIVGVGLGSAAVVVQVVHVEGNLLRSGYLRAANISIATSWLLPMDLLFISFRAPNLLESTRYLLGFLWLGKKVLLPPTLLKVG